MKMEEELHSTHKCYVWKLNVKHMHKTKHERGTR